MLARTDALVATAKIVLVVENIGIEHKGFATVGILESKDSSINCIPGEVMFTIDLRHPRRKNLDAMERSIRTKMELLESNNPNLRFDVSKIWESPSASFNEITMECVRRSAAERFGYSAVAELESFAGHDSAMTNLQVPTAMVFVPSRDGISHSPEEFTFKEQW
jgi:acetylornithine deacetylase/succinyl-diaminopimelate desuccinylase-like protein